ncbi:MAG TPA: amidohydrolase family protein [Acidobacteriota bacterium]|nr:amidohydrolase family protein [Acidobacteriota bacterium]
MLFPHIAVGDGFSTVFTLSNAGGTVLEGTLLLTSPAGTGMEVGLESSGPSSKAASIRTRTLATGSSVPITIPPGGTSFITASAQNLFDSIRTGWARVESYGGSLGGVATFKRVNREGILTTNAGVLSAAAASVATIPIDDDRAGGRYTGFAIANPGAESISIKGLVADSNQIATTGTFTLSLGPAQQCAQFVFQCTEMPERFRGSLILTAEGGKRFSVVALLEHSGLFSAIPAIPSMPAPQSVLALVNARVIDGTGRDPLEDGIVLIYDDRIKSVGRRDRVTIPSSARIIDVHGGTILPGFFNTHVHSAFSESNLRAWVQAGVTTVRDLGFGVEHLWWPMSFRDQHLPLPEFARIIATGPPISTPGGYPTPFGGTVVLTASSAAEARTQTNLVLDHGADLIKTCLDSGLIVMGIANLPIFNKEEARAVIETAHRRGVPVSVHVTAVMDLVPAVEWGFNEIAHMVADELNDPDLVARMVAKDIYWIPTLELWSFYGLAHTAQANLRRFIAAGGKVALGTDFSGAPQPFQVGMPMHEIELMQQAGMTPMQIIVAATRNAAHVCYRDRTLGTLEPGKVADVLVVNGDPLQDLHALTNVRLVVHGGTVVRSSASP